MQPPRRLTRDATARLLAAAAASTKTPAAVPVPTPLRQRPGHRAACRRSLAAAASHHSNTTVRLLLVSTKTLSCRNQRSARASTTRSMSFPFRTCTQRGSVKLGSNRNQQLAFASTAPILLLAHLHDLGLHIVCHCLQELEMSHRWATYVRNGGLCV
jgi:hypothetical protein